MIGIKDMEMPNSCDMCDFYEDILCCDGEHSYCGFPRMGEVVEDYIASRHPDCPLVEIKEGNKLSDSIRVKCKAVKEMFGRENYYD